MDFNSLKANFTTDSKKSATDPGLDWKAHFDTFIQYTQTKMLEQIIVKLDEIKGKIPADFNNVWNTLLNIYSWSTNH